MIVKKPTAAHLKKLKTWKKEIFDRADIRNPEALLAWLGREKYGYDKFSKMALAGRRKGSKKR